MWYYIIAVALSAVCAILLICCFSTAHKEAARRERERKRREAKLDREIGAASSGRRFTSTRKNSWIRS